MKALYQAFLQCNGVSTDTRNLKEGMLFVALKGDRFDANTLIDEALAKGASAVITENKDYIRHSQCFIANDALDTLRQLATFHRKHLQGIMIAITGSNGKTTTKELLRETLSAAGSVQATRGNLNNHIGVPLTLLEMKPETQFLIVEMGANHPGEIADLCETALPQYGLITNIGHAHLDGFGGFEGVVLTKTEMYRHIATKGLGLFVHAEDPLLMQHSEGMNRILYGTETLSAHIKQGKTPFMELHWSHLGEEFNSATRLIGNYNLPNVLAAIGIALHFGAPAQQIHQKIEAYIPSNMRSQWLDSGKNMMILDAYNANPSSMQKALENFRQMDAPHKLAILGDMLELGEYAKQEHQRIVQEASNDRDITYMFIGPEFAAFASAYKHMQFYQTTIEAANELKKTQIKGYTILLKGSRGIGVDQLKDIL